MRIEDRLTDQARRLRRHVDATVAPDDVDRALAGATAAPSGATSVRSGRNQRWLLGLAAAVVVVVAMVVGAIVAGDDDEQLVADGGSDTTVPEKDDRPVVPVDIPIDVLAELVTPEAEVGSIAYFRVSDALADHWLSLGQTGPMPEVDFLQQAVLAFTLPSTARCAGAPLGLDREGDQIRPVFVADPEFDCDAMSSTANQTYLIAAHIDDLPTAYDFILEAPLVGDGGPFALSIEQSESFSSFTPASPTPTEGPALGPDLERPEAGREITFDAIGEVGLGQTFGPSEFQRHEGSACGYWGPGEPSHDGDEPLNGLVAIDGDVGTVITVMVRGNARYRTASGVGVGTTLASLERIYGADLVVDRADGWESPTDGLTAYYVDVGAVRNGERALTFYLQGDVVEAVKLSAASFWGDDEGCA